MKIKKGNLFLLFSTIALLILLAIQVYWILQTAKIKEALFNEKANLVLSKTTEALSTDEETCKNIGECIDSDSISEVTSRLAKNDIKKIDSLLNHYMQLYHIQINYTFNIARKNNNQSFNKNSFANSIFMMPLADNYSKKGIEIKLIFPEKKQFVIAEMGIPFITSIILIVTMMIIFWKTNLSLLKEKKIAIHTTDFLNNMSHEFKTPLSNIKLAAKMVFKQKLPHDEEKVKHYANIIIEENDKLTQQIDMVLNLNALERDEILINKKEFDFHELISVALKNTHMQIEHHKCVINLALTASNYSVIGDKQQLTSVICNLIDNAIKYGNDRPLISIETFNKNQKLFIVFADNGKGISKLFHQKVFEKYFRVPTDDIHNVKGFGLGLAYIKRIIELHNGDIKLNSELGKGTTFIISLPNV